MLSAVSSIRLKWYVQIPRAGIHQRSRTLHSWEAAQATFEWLDDQKDRAEGLAVFATCSWSNGLRIPDLTIVAPHMGELPKMKVWELVRGAVRVEAARPVASAGVIARQVIVTCSIEPPGGRDTVITDDMVLTEVKRAIAAAGWAEGDRIAARVEGWLRDARETEAQRLLDASRRTG